MRRNVVVTGAASGLGEAVTRLLQEAGAEPVAIDKEVPRVDADYELVDLADRRATEGAVGRVSERTGGIDAVVSCAGVDSCGRLEDVSADDWERVIAVNLLGTAAVVRAALPDLRAREGQVVTVASTLGLRALSDASAYCASKFGVVGFTRALAVENAGQVAVSLLLPGGMETAFFDGRPDQYKPPPDAKLNKPIDVARAVLFALDQPPGCEVREMVITPSVEGSWP